MTTVKRGDQLRPDDLWEISHAAGRLTSYGCHLSAQYLRDYRTRMQFNRELAYYAWRIVNDVEAQRLSKDQALLEIRAEKLHLMDQSGRISSQMAGLAGGLSQAYSGVKACSSLPLCMTYGIPSIAHGLNNIYENGKNLRDGRDDAEGWVKKGYQKAAVGLGYTEEQGTKAYLLGDIAISAIGMTRMTPKPDAWRLFRYMRSDKEMAVKQMSKGALGLEILNNTQSLRQMGEISEK